MYIEIKNELWIELWLDHEFLLSCSDYRPLFVERGVLSTTNGSARIRLGGSDVLVGIKCELIEVRLTNWVGDILKKTFF